MVKDELEPMYTEEHAARLLGIPPRSLRTERENGRIGYKPVCGRVMYRLSDLVRWQKRGVPWRADGRRNPVGVLKSKIGIGFRERRDLTTGSEDREHLSCDLLMIHWRGASAAGLRIFWRPRAMSDAPKKSSAKALRVQSGIGER